MATSPSSPTSPKKSKAWLWILIAIIAVLLIVGIVAALMLSRGKKSGVTTNTTTVTNTNTTNDVANAVGTNNEPADEENADALSTTDYLEEATSVLDDLSAAIQKWSDAADLGADGSFEESTDALNEGLDLVESAEEALDGLVPNKDVEGIHDLLVEAVATMREALELGIEGNASSDPDEAEQMINDSADKIEEVGNILDDITAELDKLE
jgi:hypothetical protein